MDAQTDSVKRKEEKERKEEREEEGIKERGKQEERREGKGGGEATRGPTWKTCYNGRYLDG